MKDRRTIDRFVRAESKRVYRYLLAETNLSIKERVCNEFNISLDIDSLSVIHYLQMAGKLNEKKWQLINRDVRKGWVTISEDELEILLSERIRQYLSEKLPVPVPGFLEKELDPWTQRLIAHSQQRALEEFGTINESAYPPCIQALIQSAVIGDNLVHSGRFTMVAFLHTIGMPSEQIESIFSQSPNYNADMTEYQVNHILENEYTPLACPKMLTNGLCVHKDKLCDNDKVNHPLNYYQRKKKILEKKENKEIQKEGKSTQINKKEENREITSSSE